MNMRFDMFVNRIGFIRISENSWWVSPFLVVVHGLCSIVPRIIFFIGIIPCFVFSIDMGVVVVATESCATLVLLSISIDIGVVVVLTNSFVTSMMTGPSVSLLLSRDTSHGSVLFQILSLSGCAASNYLTLVPGRIWYSVVLVMLDPKHISLSLELVHTLIIFLMNLRIPPVVIFYYSDWPRVISFIVASSHQSRMSSITYFLSPMSLFYS